MRPISENPFVVLGVTPRSTKQEIHDAVEDALLDAATVEDERRLDTARQSLIVPNDRLNAELSYLLEMRPADAKKAAEGQSFEHWSEVAEKTEGLAATNALTFALDASPNIENSKSLLEALLIGWAKVDVSDVTSRINEARSVAGFGSVTARDVERGVAVLRQSHGERAAASLGDDDTSADALSAFLTDTVIPSKRMNDRFADDLMQSYAKKVCGALASANDRALSGLQEFVKHGASTDFAEFEIELRSWDRLAQPLQLVSETKGADDAHSKDLYEAIRSAAIDLANQDGRFQDALDITSLATEVFAELPWAADQLREDAETLNDIIANRSREEVLLPLATALSEARNQIAFTSRQLTQHGFQASSPKPIGSIWAAYVAILSSDVDVDVRDLGASMVRGLSIALVNDHSDSLNAKAITSQLRADEGWFSSELVAQITKDELELEKNVIMGDLKDAMGREEWKEASRLCSQLIALCSAKEARDISKIQQIADQKIAERTKSRVVWAILGGSAGFHDLPGL